MKRAMKTENVPWRYRLGIFFLGLWLVGHFALAALSAANQPISKVVGANRVAKALLLYQYVTGTGNCFGFFAPGVISMLKVSYEIRQGEQVIGKGLISSENDEVSLRLHNLTQQFWTASRDPKVRRSLAASMAGRLFTRYPQADTVSLMLHSFVMPSMAQYRAGRRPSWEKNYEGTFQRHQLSMTTARFP